jgi:hypothetical protein
MIIEKGVMNSVTLREFNWEVTLNDWAIGRLGADHVWGVTDCVSLIGQALTIMYGYDVLALSPWDTRAGLITRVEAAGGVQALAAKHAHRVVRRRVYSGDIALLPELDQILGWAACVVAGGVYLLSTPGVPIYALRLNRLPANAEIWRPDAC